RPFQIGQTKQRWESGLAGRAPSAAKPEANWPVNDCAYARTQSGARGPITARIGLRCAALPKRSTAGLAEIAQRNCRMDLSARFAILPDLSRCRCEIGPLPRAIAPPPPKDRQR